MRIAIASLLQESNTFSPVFTRFEDFSPLFGNDVLVRHEGKLTEMGGFLSVLREASLEPVPLMAGWAITANRVLAPDQKRLFEAFTSRLRRARPDALLLAMHGAQTAEGEDDVVGAWLEAARVILGDSVPIVVTLDLHANLTRRTVALATAIVGYHTYPHIDMFETGQKAARLLLRTLSGEVRPTMALAKLPLIIPAENSQTYRGPMHVLIRQAQRWEAAGKAEAVSIFPVQPWMDIAEMGCAVVAVTNGDARAAERMARTLARRLWEDREAYTPHLSTVAEALEAAARPGEGPVVIAESSDSTGSGSPGDSTGVLRPLLKAKLRGPAAIFVVDPAAVAACAEAGVNAAITVSVGGAFDRVHSRPVRVKGRVKLLSDGRWIARARGYNTGIETDMGRAAVLVAGQVHILLAERSAMTVDPSLFRSHGIDPVHCQIVVVKSPNGFRAEYEPIAREIHVVDTPGVSTANLTRLPFRRISRPMYPFDREIL